MKNLSLQITAIRTTLASLDAQMAAIEEALKDAGTPGPQAGDRCKACGGTLVETPTYDLPDAVTCVTCGSRYGKDEA